MTKEAKDSKEAKGAQERYAVGNVEMNQRNKEQRMSLVDVRTLIAILREYASFHFPRIGTEDDG